MLSDRDIKLAIEHGHIMIEPFHESALRPGGYSFHMGDFILKPDGEKLVDAKKGVLPEYERIEITDDKPYRLDPGDFVLGATMEKLTIDNWYSFLIEGRSTLARLGITVVQSAMMVDPGHTNRAITLEFCNNGKNPVNIYPRMKIARGFFFKLDTEASYNYDEASGKYHDQPEGGGPLFRDEFGGLE